SAHPGSPKCDAGHTPAVTAATAAEPAAPYLPCIRSGGAAMKRQPSQAVDRPEWLAAPAGGGGPDRGRAADAPPEPPLAPHGTEGRRRAGTGSDGMRDSSSRTERRGIAG